MSVRNITLGELENLLKKKCITTNDRFLIDSYVDTSLVDYCNDLKSSEIEKVRILEEKNIFRYLNATCIMLGIYGKEPLMKALTTSPFPDVLSELKQEYHGRELEKNVIFIMVKMLLALNGSGGRNIATPLFEGEMPQKFMSFRNQTANKWFEETVRSKLFVLSTIYEKSSWEEAKSHLLSSVAYQLHHSNPTKYIIDTSMSMNDALLDVLRKFIDGRCGDSSIIYSKSGEILSKIL